MAKYNELNAKTWEELLEILNNKFYFQDNYIFRGHANASWRLESSLKRSIEKQGEFEGLNNVELLQKKSHYLDQEAKILESFKKSILGRIRYEINDLSDDDIFAIGQHHGLYSPLIDFTYSPYVALFFALNGESLSGSRCIWAIDSRSALDLSNDTLNNVYFHFRLVTPTLHENNRLISQQGLFLRIPVYYCFEEILKHELFKKRSIFREFAYKITFDDKICQDGLRILDKMNLNYLTLFPDLQGSCKHSNSIFDLRLRY